MSTNAVVPEVAPARELGPDAVVAVVVTMNRRDQLVDSLKAIATQNRPVDHLIVVDNGADEPAQDVVENAGMPHTYLHSSRNLGGAGGFALGLLHTTTAGSPTRPCSRCCWPSRCAAG